mgnify:CR=1 FL=1
MKNLTIIGLGKWGETLVKSVQNKIKDKWVIIEYVTKKGKEIKRFIKIPIGRKKRLLG